MLHTKSNTQGIKFEEKSKILNFSNNMFQFLQRAMAGEVLDQMSCPELYHLLCLHTDGQKLPLCAGYILYRVCNYRVA